MFDANVVTIGENQESTGNEMTHTTIFIKPNVLFLIANPHQRSLIEIHMQNEQSCQPVP
jgi:hypothetical protein